jgi:hypothetical protein
MAPADAPKDLEALEALERLAMGDFREGSLAALKTGVDRVQSLGDVAFRKSVEAVSTALTEYADTREGELDALARWSARGRILAQAMAFGELAERTRAETRRIQAQMPGSPFVGGALHRIGRITTESLLEREEAVADRAARRYPNG